MGREELVERGLFQQTFVQGGSNPGYPVLQAYGRAVADAFCFVARGLANDFKVWPEACLGPAGCGCGLGSRWHSFAPDSDFRRGVRKTMKLVRSDSPEVATLVASAGARVSRRFSAFVYGCFLNVLILLIAIAVSLIVSVRAAAWFGVSVFLAWNVYVLWLLKTSRRNWVIAACADRVCIRLASIFRKSSCSKFQKSLRYRCELSKCFCMDQSPNLLNGW